MRVPVDSREIGDVSLIASETGSQLSAIPCSRTEVIMAHCTKCDKEVAEGSSFCQSCGEKLSAPQGSMQRAVEIARAGGVNNVAMILTPLVLVVIVGILAAIAIPRYAAYQQKEFNAQARSDIEQACNEATSILIETPETTITQPALEERGFKSSPDVELVIDDGTRPSFNMTASHNKGNMIYSADINCNISEKVKAR